MKNLIFVQTGGENGSPERSYIHYYICEGKTIEETLEDWYKQIQDYMIELYKGEEYRNYTYDKRPSKFTCSNEMWYESGYPLQIVELKDDECFNNWKKLIWQ